MFCDVCSEGKAVIHVARIINGQKSELNLCESCANMYKNEFSIVGGGYSFDNFLSGIINSDPFAVGHAQIIPEMDRCPSCGLTYGDYQHIGRLGCGHCYEHFAPRLEPIFKRIHGNTRHQGKRLEQSQDDIKRMDFEDITRMEADLEDSVETTGVELKPQTSVDPIEQELARLKSELQVKVKLEEFESAAILRDQIKELEAETTKKK